MDGLLSMFSALACTVTSVPAVAVLAFKTGLPSVPTSKPVGTVQLLSVPFVSVTLVGA